MDRYQNALKRKAIRVMIRNCLLGIYVTEDFSSKSSRQVDQEKTWRNGPLAAVEPGKLYSSLQILGYVSI